MDRFNLGSHSRIISTGSLETQRWFDLGLNWCFAFNKTEGVKCFAKALEFDPECVMAHWGIAYGCGPFYNMTWRDHSEEEANSATRMSYKHIQIARAGAPCDGARKSAGRDAGVPRSKPAFCSAGRIRSLG